MDNHDRERAMVQWRRQCRRMPAQHARLTWERLFSADEWRRISHGLVPTRMEQKWFVFADDFVVHFHRSSSGYCIYQMAVQPSDAGFSVVSILVNRDPEQYRSCDDAYDLALLDFVISNLMLGQNKPFPVPSGCKPGDVPGFGLLQHQLMGTGYPEVELASYRK
jgi:hypothetical protein